MPRDRRAERPFRFETRPAGRRRRISRPGGGGPFAHAGAGAMRGGAEKGAGRMQKASGAPEAFLSARAFLRLSAWDANPFNPTQVNAHASRRRLHIVRRDYNENLAFFRPQTIANATIHIFGKSNELFQTGQQSEPYSSYLSSFESIRLVREVNGAGFPGLPPANDSPYRKRLQTANTYKNGSHIGR